MPGALTARLGHAEVHRSLRTNCPREAARRSKRAWLATEGLFETMSRNPALQAAQAKLLLDQLLAEPLLQSPTADELADAMVRWDWTYAKMLFDRGTPALVLSHSIVGVMDSLPWWRAARPWTGWGKHGGDLVCAVEAI